jgi:two-component system sensor histidine kinase PilS (NtrC family)
MALAVALLAIVALFGEYFFTTFHDRASRSVAEVIMFAVSYLALAYLAHQAGLKARASQALADKRGEEVANLFEVNELIIRRMRTGVLVVDADNKVTLANEAASLLLGDGNEALAVELNRSVPELGRRLQRWRNGWQVDDAPLQLFPDQPEVQPRFARLLADGDLTVVFLDDTTVVSRRAESLTLAALGRFSASLAHEIRNPLAAIMYSVQLLEETAQLPEADQRLLEIIHTQCQRMNGIVQDILGLARRERSQPESIDISQFARRFVDEYRASHPLETDVLQAVSERSVLAMADPRHLHQVLTILVQNALTYGRMPGEPAKVTVSVRSAPPGAPPELNVIDRGPGIPAPVAAQIFTPFYTTSEHGTGLGLYIAQQLCEANQCSLSYQPVPGGGSCFRIIMPPGMTLMQDDASPGRLNLA